MAKYLDKEDIESLGFVPHAEIGQYYYKGRLEIAHREDSHYTQISIVDGFKKNYDRLIFEGYIETKQELEVLLKQLNIK